MKKLLRLSSLLVTAVLLAFSSKEAQASHYQGSDMTYACIAPNVYVVTMKIYRDCSGAGAPTTVSLNMKSTGCNPGRNVSMTQVGQNRIGDPYCPSIPKTCGGGNLVNYEEVVFKATVTFSAAEAQCADWIFSWSECCRPSIENLLGSSGFSLYSEAYVKLFSVATPNNVVHNNSSPEFSPLNIPIPFVCVNQEIKYSLNASEADGDSLSYELAQPLTDATTPIAYSAIGGTSSAPLFNPNPLPPYNTIPFGTPGSNQQFAVFPPGQTNYSATYPISSYNVNWNAINPATNYPYNPVPATPYFLLDPLSGQLSFRPSIYNAGTISSAGRNKYAVVVKIKEWRKINGVMVNIGYIRRDILFIVENCSGNMIPGSVVTPPPPIVGATVGDTVFKVQTCTTTRLVVNFTDANNDTLNVEFAPNPVAGIPNGTFSFANNNTTKPTAVITVTPLPGDVGKVYFIPAKISDDACPIKGIQNKIYKIEVVAENRVDILDTVQTICQGQSLPIEAKLLRPDSILGQPAIYTYQWESAPGLNPAEEKMKNIVVTPTQDTWYKVRVNNASMNGCFDVDSILVKVQPNPVINSITVAYKPNKENKEHIVFGRSAQINVQLAIADTGFTYSWSPGKDLSDSTVMNPIASPLKTTDYTLTVTSSDGKCETSKKVTVVVGPFFLPNVITPNNDNLNDVFEYKGIQPSTSLKIYNRWGVMIKEYSSYDNSFNGEGVSDGTYYYMMQEPNGGKSYKGWFEIVRD